MSAVVVSWIGLFRTSPQSDILAVSGLFFWVVI